MSIVTTQPSVVGTLPQGFPMPLFPVVDMSDMLPLAAGALGITLVLLMLLYVPGDYAM